MPWWKSSKSSSSSSTPSSPATAPSSPSRIFPWSRKDDHHHRPRFGRLRKIQYIQVGIGADGGRRGGQEGGQSLSTPVSRSPSSLDDIPLSARSASSPVLLPHRLPTPESASASPQHRDCVSGRCPLPSPKAATVRSGDREERNGAVKLSSLMSEPTGEKFSVGSRSAHQMIHKNPENGDAPAALLSSGRNIYGLQDSNASKHSFRLNVPARSAPGSGISSPILSPRRLSTGDFFQSANFAPSLSHPWSSSEFPASDFMTGFYSQNQTEKILASPGRSPLHSPKVRTPAVISRNPSPPCSPMHQMVFPDKLTAWHDNNGNLNVHPLPLPPGAPASPQPSFPPNFCQHSAKVEASSSMANQWQKGKLIGSGTFGYVYIATNRNDGSQCAMKEVDLIPDDPKSAERIKQLQQEIRFLSQLKHPNIVQYYGSDIVEDRFYIYLEYVHPGSINKYVNENCGAITESVVRCFSRHILEGLAYLHSANVMHRDIKGANLLVNSSGVVKLADFGMAKHLGEAKGAFSLQGTPYWMAPEILQASVNKDLKYDLAVDIWSLGCTIIEMYTGKHPWSGLETAAAMFKILRSSPDIPETLSAEGKEFLQCCFRRNPAERPSASQLLEHPFVSNSHRLDLNGSIPAFAGMKLSDGPQSSSNNNVRHTGDSTTKPKHLLNGETSQLHHEVTDLALSRSPRSTLDAVPSSPQHTSLDAVFLPGLSTNVLNGVHERIGRGSPFHPLTKSRGKKTE